MFGTPYSFICSDFYFNFQVNHCVLAQIKSEKNIYLSSFNAPLVPDLVVYCLIHVP